MSFAYLHLAGIPTFRLQDSHPPWESYSLAQLYFTAPSTERPSEARLKTAEVFIPVTESPSTLSFSEPSLSSFTLFPSINILLPQTRSNGRADGRGRPWRDSRERHRDDRPHRKNRKKNSRRAQGKMLQEAPEGGKVVASLGNFRRLAVRYERRVKNYLGFVHLGCMMLLRHS